MGPAKYWIGTASEDLWSPYSPLPEMVSYASGQKEIGSSGFCHWQLYLVLKRKQRLSWLSRVYPGIHWEPTRSDAAESYCWKEATRVEGSQFALGSKPVKRNSVIKNLLSQPIGIQSEKKRKLETLTPSPQMFIYGIIMDSKESLKTMYDRLLWSEPVQYFGAQLEQAKVTAPGKKPVFKLTLRIRLRNGGMDTEIKNMLSSMNFEELSTSRMYLDGSTSILSRWKLKVVKPPCVLPSFGSLQISTQSIGTQTLIR